MLLLLLACSAEPTDTAKGGDDPLDWRPDTSPPTWDTTVAPTAPEIGFMLPLDGALYDVDDWIRIEILAGDLDVSNPANLTLSWGGVADGRADAPLHPGADGTIDFTIEPQDLGDYVVSVEVRDDGGLVGSAESNFSVVERDADRDGFENAGLGGDDCDDSRVDVSPVAEEVCDEVDNDCDGAIDEDVTTRFYQDADGDGYGDAAVYEDVCEESAGWVLDATDCDDTRAEVRPGFGEACDELDNDCDGVVDEEVQSTFWRDVDGDGYGDTADSLQACEAPSGYVANEADCLDTDAAVSPDATEVCLDGLDNDCDGSSNSCGIGGTVELSAADAQLRGAGTQDYAGYAVAAAGDVDADGLADVVIGAFGAETGGAAYVVSGPITGVSYLSSAGLTLLGEASGDGAGYSVSGGFDWNNDGFDDALVGAYGNDSGGSDAGRAYVVLGPATGSVSLGSADLILTGEAASDQAGLAVAAAGDVDGDGNEDLLVGAWGDDDGGSMAGAAYLVSGPDLGSLSLSASTAKLIGENAGDFAGFAVASGGDSNGDGLADVLIGGYGASSAAGRAWLVYGPISGTIDLSGADVSYYGETIGDDAGASVSGDGDVDGDGLDDAIIGAYGHDYGAADAGAAYVMLGGAHSGVTTLATMDAKVVGDSGGDAAGWSVSAVPDMDGDGSDDLLVGAQLNDHGGTDAGAAYLLYGPITTLYDLGSADARFYGENGADYAGASVAGVGDTDGDTKGDILVGAPYEDYGANYLGGSAYLVRGTGL